MSTETPEDPPAAVAAQPRAVSRARSCRSRSAAPARCASSRRCGGKGAHLLVGTQKDADIEEPAGADLYTICVEGEVVRIVKAAENRVTAVLRGIERRRVTGFAQEKPYLVATYEPLVEIRKDPIEIDGLGMAVYDVAKQLIAISPDIPDETAQVLDQNKDPAPPGRHRRRDRRPVARGARLAAGRESTWPSGCAGCWCCCSARSS